MMNKKQSIQKLLQDLQPSVKQDLIRVYRNGDYNLDIVFPMDLRHHRDALAAHIRVNYSVKAIPLGSLMLFVTIE